MQILRREARGDSAILESKDLAGCGVTGGDKGSRCLWQIQS